MYGHDGFLVETEAVGQLVRRPSILPPVTGARSPEPTSARSLSFGEEAAAYERGRPSYPPEAIDWLLPRGAVTCWTSAPGRAS